jgi:hypothetical protein
MRPAGDAPPHVAALRRAGGDALFAVIGFGSRFTGATPDERSAWDLFVIVEDYRAFYRGAGPALGWRRSPTVLARLNAWLPPSVAHLADADGPGAKLFLISRRDLAEKLDPRGLDRFCRARLMQRVEILFVRDETGRRELEAALAANRREQIEWIRPFLRAEFDVNAFGRELLRISYGTEIRPEANDRSAEVFAAQRADLAELYGPELAAAAGRGILLRENGRYRFAAPVSGSRRLRARLRFQASKALTTLRWAKHMVTFEGWLDYIVAKVERRTDVRVELTPRERRYPLLFLWPKFFRVLRAGRRPHETGSG